MLFDDTMFARRPSQRIELVRRQYSGNAHGISKGIGLVILIAKGIAKALGEKRYTCRLNVPLPASERTQWRQWQQQRRDTDGYLKVTVGRLLDNGRSAGSLADDSGLEEALVYRYAAAFAEWGLTKWLAPKPPGYWGLLTSAHLAHLYQPVNAQLYTDCKDLQDWLLRTYRVAYARAGLPDFLPRRGFACQLPTPVPCQAEAQADVLDELAVLEAPAERGEAVRYAAAHPPHTRCPRAGGAVGQERPLLPVSGRERGKLHAARNAYAPTPGLVAETSGVNAQSTKRPYEQLLAAHPATTRLYVVWDNARSYKKKALRSWLAATPICQVFLPPYAPRLHLKERLWKYLRQQIITPPFYCTKGQFRTAVLAFFTRLPEFGQDLASLLTRKLPILDAQLTS